MLWNFWTQNKKWSKKNRWDIKKIAFVSILIATSVAFILIFTTIFPIAALPSFKLTIGGLPIKLTGYVFGPFIGAITGLLSDILSFMLRPTFFHWAYSISFMVAGFFPGLLGYVMNRRWKNRKEVNELFEKKYIYSNFIFTMLLLAAIVSTLTWFILFYIPDDFFMSKHALVSNRWFFWALTMAGMGTMFVSMPIFFIILKPATFNSVIPIIAFSIFLEIINTPTITYADMVVWEQWNSNDPHIWNTYIDILSGHLIMTPAKIWFNLFIIFVAYKIVSPLIYNKQQNGW